jgi:hypothetical protein
MPMGVFASTSSVILGTTRVIRDSDSTAEVAAAITDIFRALIWPAVLIALAIIFRRAITELIQSIREARWKGAGLELTIKRDLEETERLLSKAERAEAPKAAVDAGIAPIMDLASISPRAAIMEAWALVETAGAQIAR